MLFLGLFEILVANVAVVAPSAISIQVGSTEDRKCDLDHNSGTDNCNFATTPQGRSWSSPSGGSVGVAFGQFMSGSNMAPIKPFKGLMSYNANGGLTVIKGEPFLSCFSLKNCCAGVCFLFCVQTQVYIIAVDDMS